MLKSFVLAAALAGVLPAAVAQTAFMVNGQFVSVEEQMQLMDFLRANGVTNEKPEAFFSNKKSSNKLPEMKVF